MYLRRIHASLLGAVSMSLLFLGGAGHAQDVPTGEQLEQLLAPIALYPDTLLAQICAASADPQQIIDADAWLKQNSNLQGQALIDAAQMQGFDPAFISLVTFPMILDAMARNVDDYAALGAAFKENQGSVMAAIQSLRQQAYASGALDSNEYQNVSVEQQDGAQVVVVEPANPQVIYVPQYQPQQVFVSGGYPGDYVAGSLLSFSAGVAIGALINDQPWGWHRWRWGWGGRGMIYGYNPWRFNYHYRSPRPYYRPRPPIYNRPIHARPPSNWNQRPGYRPPPGGYRPGGQRPGAGRPPDNRGDTRPPGNGGRPPGNGAARPPNNSGARPAPTPNPARAGRNPAQNPYAGFPQEGNRPPAQRPAMPQQRPATPQQRPAMPPPPVGARPGAFSGNNNGKAERAASDRGRASANRNPPQGRQR